MSLALIVGRGNLPAAVVAALDVRPLVCVLNGFDPNGLQPDLHFRLEHLGSLIADLQARGVSQVCFCGAIERPPVDPAAIDAATLPLVPLIMKAMASGDDAALRAVVHVFEQSGFAIRAAHDLAPALLAPEGTLSTRAVTDAMRADMARADAVLAALAPLDVGQGCVVGKGLVWGIETTGGTDHMLATLPDTVGAADALLVKEPKAGQELRVDMPAIGPQTIDALVAAGLAGVVIRAGSTLVLDRAETLRRADEAGLVIFARAPA
ncbi:MAG: LpxI family protein [Roseobacter sp.]